LEDLDPKVVTIRSSRQYPGEQSHFKEIFVIYDDSSQQTSHAIYFDAEHHATHCTVESSLNCTITCQSDGVHMRYTFGRRDGKPYFQWQVPPPHRHAEFVPYVTGFLEPDEDQVNKPGQ
jgi:hypothetical protein